MPKASERPLDILASLGIHHVTAATPVTGGLDTEIWRIEHDGLVSALRVMRAEQTAAAEIERTAMHAASAVLPVPDIRASAIWNNQPVMLIEWMPGEPLLRAVAADLPNAKAWGRLLGEAQARLHEVEAPPGLPSPAESWLGRLNPELPADAAGSALLHFDFHPLNVLVHEGQVSGVIDWTGATAGNPRLDAARSWAILECAPIAFPGMDAKASHDVLSQFWSGWQDAYEERRGALQDFDSYRQWALVATSRDLNRTRPGKNRKGETVAGISEVLSSVIEVVSIVT